MSLFRLRLCAKPRAGRSDSAASISDPERGAVLVAVIIIFAVLSVVGTTVFTSSYAAAGQADRQQAVAQARQYAQQGVNTVTAYLNNGKTCDTSALQSLATSEHWAWASADGSSTVSKPSCPQTTDNSPTTTNPIAITGSATGKLPQTGTQTYTTRVKYTRSLKAIETNGDGIPGSGITSASTSDVNLQYSQTLGTSTGITANGNVNCQGTVQGDITAKGNVTIYAGCDVNGNITAGGAVIFQSSQTTTVKGNITAVGDVTIQNSSIVQGSITSGGNISTGGTVHSLYTKGTIDVINGSVSGDIVSDSDITIENSPVEPVEVTCSDPSISSVVCGNIVSLGGSVISKEGGRTVASGDVYAAKTISLTSSGVYLGNLYAVGDISLTYETIDKNIYSQGIVNFTNWWGTVKGDVSAQNGITVNGGSQHIYGNITVPAGSIQIADNLHIENTPSVTVSGTVDTRKLPSGATVVQNAQNISAVKVIDANSFSYPHDSSSTDSPQPVKQPDAPATVVLPKITSTQSSLASWTTPKSPDGTSQPALQRYIFSSSSTYANGVQSWTYDSCRRAENFINQGSWGTDSSGKESWTMVQVGNCSEPMELAPWNTDNAYSEQAEWNGTLLLHGNLILISDSGFNLTHGLTVKSPAGKHYSLYLIVPSDAQEYVSGSSVQNRSVSGNIQTGTLSRDDGNNYTATISDGDAWSATKSSYMSWDADGKATCSPTQSNYGNITFGNNQKYNFVSDTNSSVDVLMYTPCAINDSGQFPSLQGILSGSQVNITGGMTFNFTSADMFLPWTGKVNSESGTPSSDGSNTSGGSSGIGAGTTGWQSLYYSVTDQERCRDADPEKGQGTCHD